jgi:two-component system response regulator GlrR
MSAPPARILVIDDNDDSRQLMSLLLSADGYDVDQAASALDGLRCLEARRYALVLTDYHMPDHSGLWLLDQAQRRQLLDGAVTMVVTADYDAAELMDEASVIRKPVDFKRLLPQLRAMLGPKDEATPAASQEDQMARTEPAIPERRIELVLYVTPDSISCHRARAAMQEILQDYDADAVDFRVYDLDEHLGDAQRDRIIFTPTLVKRWPDPKVWVLGDLTRRAVVIDLLDMAGVRPKTSA